MRRWTADEERFVADRSIPVRILAAAIGRTEQAVRRRRWLCRRRK